MGAIGPIISVGVETLMERLFCSPDTLLRNRRIKKIIKHSEEGVCPLSAYKVVLNVKDLTELDKLIYDID